ncbi:MAG: hypothetical protein PUB23_02810 [Bacilli bacterium]|nr:hypothetical protein [Bacilli bacterium]
MRKQLLVLSMASILMLGSCAKEVTFEEAKAHAKENYVQSNVEYTKCVSRTIMDVKKSSGIFGEIFEVGKNDSGDVEMPVGAVLSATEIAAYGDSYTYKIDGKKMIISKSVSAKEYLSEKDVSGLDKAEISGKGSSETYYYNEVGLLTKAESSIDVSFKVSIAGFSVEGELVMSALSTITYSK